MKYYDVFTSGAPPHEQKLLVGRDKEIEKLRLYLKSPGIHPIVVGPRGIGKTSLVQFVLDDYKIKTQIEANTVKDFNELARCICVDIGIDDINTTNSTTEENTGIVGKGKIVIAEGELNYSEKTTEEKKGLSESDISPQLLKRLLQSEKDNPAVISIDELDDIDKNNDIKIKLAKFTKSISNQARWFHHKFIFSGIGKDSHDLFGEHLSSNRNIPVIYLNQLSKSNFLLFFEEAEKKLDRKIPEIIKNTISSDADGFPYYVHQVGFHMMSVFESDTTSKKIDVKHYEEGKKRAFDDAFSHYLRRYKFTIYNLEDLEKIILRAIVTNNNTHLNFDKLLKECSFYHGTFEDEIKKNVRKLYDKGYLRYRKSDNAISLDEPLLKPFLKMKLKIKDDENQLKLI